MAAEAASRVKEPHSKPKTESPSSIPKSSITPTIRGQTIRGQVPTSTSWTRLIRVCSSGSRLLCFVSRPLNADTALAEFNPKNAATSPSGQPAARERWTATARGVFLYPCLLAHRSMASTPHSSATASRMFASGGLFGVVRHRRDEAWVASADSVVERVADLNSSEPRTGGRRSCRNSSSRAHAIMGPSVRRLRVSRPPCIWRIVPSVRHVGGTALSR